MTGDDVNDLARTLLADPDAARWEAADFLEWLNAARRDIITHEPKAGTGTLDLTIPAETNRVAVPTAVTKLLNVDMNTGTDGSTPGRPISRVVGDQLIASRPRYTRDFGGEIRHWWDDDRDRGYFYVWPKLRVQKHVRGLGVSYPADVANLAADLSLDGAYLNPMVHNVLSRAYARDAEDVKNLELAAMHMAIYGQLMGVKVEKLKKYGAGANSSVNPAHPAVEKNGA
jgi:hypothetical protein